MSSWPLSPMLQEVFSTKNKVNLDLFYQTISLVCFKYQNLRLQRLKLFLQSFDCNGATLQQVQICNCIEYVKFKHKEWPFYSLIHLFIEKLKKVWLWPVVSAPPFGKLYSVKCAKPPLAPCSVCPDKHPDSWLSLKDTFIFQLELYLIQCVLKNILIVFERHFHNSIRALSNTCPDKYPVCLLSLKDTFIFHKTIREPPTIFCLSLKDTFISHPKTWSVVRLLSPARAEYWASICWSWQRILTQLVVKNKMKPYEDSPRALCLLCLSVQPPKESFILGVVWCTKSNLILKSLHDWIFFQYDFVQILEAL